MPVYSESSNQFQEGVHKICDLAHDTAKFEGVTIDSIVLDNGRPVGCLDFHLIDISAGGHQVSIKLHHNEIEDFPEHAAVDLTQQKIRSALSRLKILLDP